jgi:hypothetical protein
VRYERAWAGECRRLLDRYTADFVKAHELISAAEQQARQRAHLAQALVSLAADPGPRPSSCAERPARERLSAYRGGMTTDAASSPYPDRPVVLTADELAAIADSLPPGMTLLGGFHSHGAGSGATDDPGQQTTVITVDDDFNIHKVVIKEIDPHHFEIISDVIILDLPSP